MPLRVTIHPNRVSITPHSLLSHEEWEPEPGTWHDPNLYVNYETLARKNSLANLKIRGNPFLISESGKKRMQDRITAMYRLSTPRTVKAGGNKLIYNFRCAFITLTLPAVQMHTDKEIKNLCLNPFFLELRKFYDVENYVWKAELQHNKNIHFHIIVDRFINYYALRRRWNRILERLGYVSRYALRMESGGVGQYITNAKKYNPGASVTELKMRYAKGSADGWKSPNSVDVRVLRNDKDVAVYLSKYMVKGFTKNEEGDYSEEDLAVLERGKNFGRAWFCSRSLSRLNTKLTFSFSQVQAILEEIKDEKFTKEFVGDFFRVYYFRYERLSFYVQQFMRGWLMANAAENNYIYPT